MKKKASKKPPAATAKTTAKKRRSSKILAAGDPAPFQLFNERGQGLGLIICDHSGNRVPRALKGLGLAKSELNRHIGWDIGTEDIGRYFSKALDMPAILAVYSRLVVDLNRAPHHPECIPAVSDHTEIPANAGLSKRDKEQRLKELFRPYQEQIGKQVDRFIKKKKTPLILSIHSFTPELDGKKRPWHIAILWNKQEKLAKQLIAEVRRKHPGLLVGSNEPYTLKDGRFVGSTMYRHAEQNGLPYVFVEFRQDLVDTKEKAQYWAELFLQVLKPVIGKA